MAERSLPPIEETALNVATNVIPPDTSKDTPEVAMARIRAFNEAQRGIGTARSQLNLERAAGLPSFRAEGTLAETTPTTRQVSPTTGNFVSALTDAVNSSLKAKREQLLNADQSFDTQLLIQKGALVSSLFGENVTPEELRWLSPSQQAAVRAGKEDALKAQLSGINAIFNERKEKQKEEREQAENQFKLLSESGAAIETLPEGLLEKLDFNSGLPTGTYEAVYKAKYDKTVSERQTAEFEAADKLLNVLIKLPVGEKIQIGDSTYSSLKVGEITTGTESGPDGTFLWTYNKDTGEKTTHFLGDFGNQKYTDITSNEGALLRVFEDGSQRLMFDPRQPDGGKASGGLIDLFPERSVTPFTRPGDPDKNLASECGAWINDITGLGVGSTYQSKIQRANPGINKDNAQIGDVFIQPFGTTGHVGIINGKSVINGETIFTVSESNWEKKAGTKGRVGLITHTRQVKASEITGYARPGLAQDFYNFGSDMPSLEGLTFGEEPVAEKPLSAEASKIKANVESGLNDIEVLQTKVRESVGRGRFLDRQYKAAENNIIDIVGRMRSGGAITKEEANSFRKLLPAFADSDATSISKLNRLETLFSSVLSSITGNETGTVGGGSLIRVREKTTGRTGSIPSNEFDENKYERL